MQDRNESGGAWARLGPLIAVARAPFLALPVALVAVGGAAAAYDGAFSVGRTGLALLGLVAAHVAVNVLNEISDLRTGIDLRTQRTPFSGGSGTLPEGRMDVRSARWLAWLSLLVSLGVGLWFLQAVGLVLLPVLLLGAACVLLYTNVLTRLGIGEIAAGLGLGGLPVLGTALVQAGGLGPAAVAASVPATLMTFNLLLLNEFPDADADRHGGRRHLVIRWGRRGAATVYAIAALAVPAWLVAAASAAALPWAALAGLFGCLALRAPLRWALERPEGPVPTGALAANVTWNLATNLLTAVGLVVSVGLGR